MPTFWHSSTTHSNFLTRLAKDVRLGALHLLCTFLSARETDNFSTQGGVHDIAEFLRTLGRCASFWLGYVCVKWRRHCALPVNARAKADSPTGFAATHGGHPEVLHRPREKRLSHVKFARTCRTDHPNSTGSDQVRVRDGTINHGDAL